MCIRDRLEGHTHIVSASWCPAGGDFDIVSSSWGNVVTLWNSVRRSPRRELGGQGGKVGCIAWSPCGRTLFTASQDGTVRIYNVDTLQGT